MAPSATHTLAVAILHFLALSPALTFAHPAAAHDHVEKAVLPDMPNLLPNVHELFKRQNGNYPPQDVAGPQPRQEWVTAYNAAVQQGLIPQFAPSVLRNGWPAYTGNTPASTICSWTVSKCEPAGDVINAPTGMSGISFDDGPQQPTAALLPYLRQHNQRVTHFMIGSRIVDNMALFQQAVNQNQDHIAVHTWSHPYMTTQTDMGVLGELGWTMQIIFDQSGYVPAWWRPPYGDVDARVRAIAKHVFGLTTVIWNQDTDDWCLSDSAGQGSACTPGNGPQNYQALVNELTGWYNGPKSPGLIILEHELNTRAVNAFMALYPSWVAGGWDTRAIPDLFGAVWYQNSPNGTVAPSKLADFLPTGSSPFTGSASYVAQLAASVSATVNSSTSSALPSFSTSAAPLTSTTVLPLPSTTSGPAGTKASSGSSGSGSGSQSTKGTTSSADRLGSSLVAAVGGAFGILVAAVAA